MNIMTPPFPSKNYSQRKKNLQNKIKKEQMYEKARNIFWIHGNKKYMKVKEKKRQKRIKLINKKISQKWKNKHPFFFLNMKVKVKKNKYTIL